MGLRDRVLATLANKLSASMSQLIEVLSTSPDELQPVLLSLENEGLIHRAVDQVTGDVLLSPTSRGILACRRAADVSRA